MSGFTCDYEVAVMNAIKEAFPEVKITGCYFHFKKATKKKTKELKANETAIGRRLLRMATTLPLLPPNMIHGTKYWK